MRREKVYEKKKNYFGRGVLVIADIAFIIVIGLRTESGVRAGYGGKPIRTAGYGGGRGRKQSADGNQGD